MLKMSITYKACTYWNRNWYTSSLFCFHKHNATDYSERKLEQKHGSPLMISSNEQKFGDNMHWTTDLLERKFRKQQIRSQD